MWKAHYLDASAAVKLATKEPGSGHLRNYFLKRSGFFMTGLCLAEALGVLKRKLLKGDISKDQYFPLCYFLLGRVRSGRITLDDVELTDINVFNKAEQLGRIYNLDLSDALLIVSVKHGKFGRYSGNSKTILITADRDLQAAAQKEGLKVWNCEQAPCPPD